MLSYDNDNSDDGEDGGDDDGGGGGGDQEEDENEEDVLSTKEVDSSVVEVYELHSLYGKSNPMTK